MTRRLPRRRIFSQETKYLCNDISWIEVQSSHVDWCILIKEPLWRPDKRASNRFRSGI
jgi:hypothetical protein